MDFYSLTRDTIADVYKVTVFIRTVVGDARSYKEDLAKIEDDFDLELVYLKSFKDFFLDVDQGRQFKELPAYLQIGISTTLGRLKEPLSHYQNVANKHGLDVSDAETTLAGITQLPSKDDALVENDTAKNKGMIRSAVEKLARKMSLEEKLLEYEWALFGKEKLEELLEKYRTWSEKLRQIMDLIVFIDKSISGFSRAQLEPGEVGYEVSRGLRIEKVVRRQHRSILEHPDHIHPLEGTLTLYDDESPTPTYTVGILDTGIGKADGIIMERYTYQLAVDGLSRKETRQLRENLVRRLYWLLKDEVPTEVIKPDKGSLPMYLLKCMGYWVSGEDDLSLVYERPDSSGDLMTLHDWINPDRAKKHALRQEERYLEAELKDVHQKTQDLKLKEPSTDSDPSQGHKLRNTLSAQKTTLLRKIAKIADDRKALSDARQGAYGNKRTELTNQGVLPAVKPSIGTRLYLAWSLASTVYNIHASGWVHKDIWSHSILTFGRHDLEGINKTTIPYLVGWSGSRPQDDEHRKLSPPVIRMLEKSILLIRREAPKEVPKGLLKEQAHAEDKNLPFFEELEHEVYRHEERSLYQESFTPFQNKHDIYSLGVVLLEIGLWSTVSIELDKDIHAISVKTPSPRGIFPDIQKLRSEVRSKSQSPELIQQMGKTYANIVSLCLHGSFQCLKETKIEHGKRREERSDEEEAELAYEFLTTVVEPLGRMASLL